MESEGPPAPEAVDPAGLHYTYVVNKIELPTSAADAIQLGFNLDNSENGRPKNAFGQILSAILGLGDYRERVSDEIDARIAGGELIHLLDVQAVSLEDAERVGFLPFLGDDPDGDPADNWPGPEFYTTTTEGSTAVGTIQGGGLFARRGRLPLAFALPNVPELVVLDLRAAEVAAFITADGMAGAIGGAIIEADIDRVLMPVLQLALQEMVNEDCDENGVCTASSLGQTVLNLFDRDDDGVVTLEEVRDNALIRSLFTPDVDLFDQDGNYNPRADGVKDSLSFGVRFTAVPAEFMLPTRR